MKVTACVHAQSFQSCPTLCDPNGPQLASSSVQGIFPARILECVAMTPPGDLPDPGIEPMSPALPAESLSTESPGKPWRWLETFKDFWNTGFKLLLVTLFFVFSLLNTCSLIHQGLIHLEAYLPVWSLVLAPAFSEPNQLSLAWLRECGHWPTTKLEKCLCSVSQAWGFPGKGL